MIHGGVINFKFHFAFQNILIYNRVTFKNRVACYVGLVLCCVDSIRKSWQTVETSWKEFYKISVLKIPTNRKITSSLYKIWGNTCDGVPF